MADQQIPKYILTVRVKDGLVVRDTPRSQSDGGLKLRTEPVGKILRAYNIIWVGPVQYAQLVPQNPLKSEWVRVAESDNSIVYVEVEPINPSVQDGDLVVAVNRLTKQVERLVSAMENNK